MTYAFGLNASRGLATDPLMVRFSGKDVTTWRRAVSRCAGTATVVGLIIGACSLGAAAVLHGTTGASFCALALAFPGLMLQDSWRFSFFAHGQGARAFVNDLVWGIMLFPALVVLRATGHADVFWFVLAWGGSAGVAAAIGPLQSRVIPHLSGAWSWIRDNRDLGPRYVPRASPVPGPTSSAPTASRSCWASPPSATSRRPARSWGRSSSSTSPCRW